MLLTNSTAQATSFGLKASAKAFKILSSGIYKYKIRAVVREISCNAADSHVMAGCPDLPFSVHTPTKFEPWFSVTDYGVGLSDEDVLHLYTTYFDSNKKADDSGDEFSNLFTGGMGLGSKSPLAYTDQYMVHSWHGGYKRSYNAYMLESGQPDIKKIAEVKLTGDEADRTGFEVYVPVNDRDIREWRAEIERVLPMFEVLPDISPLDTEIKSKVAGWEDYNFFDHMSTPIVWMGNVAYPLHQSDLARIFDKIGKSDLYKLFHEITRELGAPIIKFPLNSFDFQPSREEIDLTEKTIAAIGTRLAEIVDTVIADTQAALDAYTGKHAADFTHKYRKFAINYPAKFTRFGKQLTELTLFDSDTVIAWAGTDIEIIQFLSSCVKIRSKHTYYTRMTINEMFYPSYNNSHAGPTLPRVDINDRNQCWHRNATTILVHDQRSHISFYVERAMAKVGASEVVCITQNKANAHLVDELLATIDTRWSTILRTSDFVADKVVPPKHVTAKADKKTAYLVATFTPGTIASSYTTTTKELYAADLKTLADDTTTSAYYMVSNRNEDAIYKQQINFGSINQALHVMSLHNVAKTIVLVSPSKEKIAINAGLPMLDACNVLKAVPKNVVEQVIDAYQFKRSDYSIWRYGRSDIAMAVLSAEPDMSEEHAAYAGLDKYNNLNAGIVSVAERLGSRVADLIKQQAGLPNKTFSPLDALKSCNTYGEDKLTKLVREKYPLAIDILSVDSDCKASKLKIQHALQYIAMIQKQETSQ